MAVSPTAKHLAVTTSSGDVRIHHLASGELAAPPMKQVFNAYDPTFSADGKLLATSGPGEVNIWEVATGTLRVAIPQPNSVHHLAFSPDSRRLAVHSTTGGTVRVWDTSTGRPTSPVMTHLSRADATITIHFLEFSGDGRRLFSGSSDSVRVWDASTGEPLTPPLRPDKHVVWCGLRPDGNQLATVSTGLSPVLWNLAVGERSAADWLALARLQSRSDVDETGTLEPLVDADVLQLWDELQRRFPQDANTPLPQLADWQIQEASRLRGHNLHSDAADVMQRAVAAAPARANLQGGLALLCTPAGLWNESIAAADRAIELGLEDADLYWYRGWAKAVLEDWEAARRDFATACAADSTNFFRHDKLAVATFAAGDIDAFKPMVAADGIAALLGDAPDAQTLNSVAWHMLFTPHGDSARAQELVEKALEPEPELANRLNTLALAYYRAEKYEAAVELTTRLTQSEKIEPLDLLFLAMAQHRLGKVEEAQAAWKKAETLLDEADRLSALDPSLRSEWAIRICNNALRAEAAALIQTEPPP